MAVRLEEEDPLVEVSLEEDHQEEVHPVFRRAILTDSWDHHIGGQVSSRWNIMVRAMITWRWTWR